MSEPKKFLVHIHLKETYSGRCAAVGVELVKFLRTLCNNELVPLYGFNPPAASSLKDLVISAVIRTDKPAAEITKAITGYGNKRTIGLSSGDTFLIIELGSDFVSQGFSAFSGWFSKH